MFEKIATVTCASRAVSALLLFPGSPFALKSPSLPRLQILELRKSNIEQARSNFQAAQKISPHMFEPFFNGALVAFKLGDCQVRVLFLLR